MPVIAGSGVGFALFLCYLLEGGLDSMVLSVLLRLVF